MPTLTITTDKTSYLPGDVIVATLAVAGAPTTETLHITGTATVRTADGTTVQLPASTDVTIGSVYVVDAVAGYTVEQHAPGVFTLTPTA